MPQKIFFQCSLPRVGSTMFQNLMNQDSRFYASANNGLLDMVTAAKYNYLNSPEFKAQDAELMRKAFAGFCRGSMHGFYNAITDKPYVLDKSRGHFANYDMVNDYYFGAKMICFVRNMPDIFASMEKMFRKNQHKSNVMVNPGAMQGTSTPKRVDIWRRSFEPMMNYFAHAIASGTDKKILFIKYESFCANPEFEMQRLYNYLEIPAAALDFKHIEQTIQEDEEIYEYTGLLKIRSVLAMRPPDAMETLGKDVYQWIMENHKFYNDYFGYS